MSGYKQRQIEPEEYTPELRKALELLIDSNHKATMRKAGTEFYKELRKLMPHHHTRDIAREAIFVARELCPVDDPTLARERDNYIRRELTPAHFADLSPARRNKLRQLLKKHWW